MTNETVNDTETIKLNFFVGSNDHVEVLDFLVSILQINVLKSFRQASAPDTKRVKFCSECKRARYIDVKHKAAVLS